MKKGAVLFDLYGTLIDIETDEGDPAVFAALSRYLSYRGVKIGPEDLKAVYFGEIGLRLGSSEEKNPEVDVFEIFAEIMRRHGANEYDRQNVLSAVVLFRSLAMRRFGLFPGALGALEEISRTYRTALVSDAQWAFAEPEMEMLGLKNKDKDFFQARIISSRLGFKKPDPRPFRIAIKEIGASIEECVYIGDSPERDLWGAAAAGMRCVLFRKPAGPYGGMSAEASFYSYEELYPILTRLLPD